MWILQTQNWTSIFYTYQKLQIAILKTLAYSAIFNFPLKEEEIWKYLINFQLNFNFQISNLLNKLQKKQIIQEKEAYYFLRGMELSVKQRKEREKLAQKKFAIAKRFCQVARLIPTVKLIGVSGALAMSNAHEEDDIDLFIIARSGTVWLTRFLTVLLAEILQVRRRPEGKSVKDKVCLNMFVDESCMAVPPNERDLFSAHEVVQMKLIYDKDGTYAKFLKSNGWVKSYLPNALPKTKKQKNKNKNSIAGYQLLFTKFFEYVSKKFQLFYMQPKVTNEVISNGYLRFHPVDARRFVLRRYRQILGSLHNW